MLGAIAVGGLAPLVIPGQLIAPCHGDYGDLSARTSWIIAINCRALVLHLKVEARRRLLSTKLALVTGSRSNNSMALLHAVVLSGSA